MLVVFYSLNYNIYFQQGKNYSIPLGIGAPNGFSRYAIPTLLSCFHHISHECLWTLTTCPKNVVGVSKVVFPVKYVCSNKSYFLLNFMETTLLSQSEVNLANLSFGGYYWI